MKYTRVAVGLVALGLAGPACSKSEQDGVVKVDLEGLSGLEAWVPPGTRVNRNAVGIGVMLKGSGVSMTIGPALEIDAPSLEEAKHNAKSYSAESVEGETLPDGYILTYENAGSMGVNYWLVGRRELAGVAYSCGVRSPKKEHQRSGVAICKSLE